MDSQNYGMGGQGQFVQHTVEDYVRTMLEFKVKKCTSAGCEGRWWGCADWHNDVDRRRVPTGPLAEKARKCPDSPSCPRGDDCPFLHSMAERFHPSAFKRAPHPEGDESCRNSWRGDDAIYCTFIHASEDKRTIQLARDVAWEILRERAEGRTVVISASTVAAAASVVQAAFWSAKKTGKYVTPEEAARREDSRRRMREQKKKQEAEQWREADRKAGVKEPEEATPPGSLRASAEVVVTETDSGKQKVQGQGAPAAEGKKKKKKKASQSAESPAVAAAAAAVVAAAATAPTASQAPISVEQLHMTAQSLLAASPATPTPLSPLAMESLFSTEQKLSSSGSGTAPYFPPVLPRAVTSSPPLAVRVSSPSPAVPGVAFPEGLGGAAPQISASAISVIAGEVDFVSPKPKLCRLVSSSVVLQAREHSLACGEWSSLARGDRAFFVLDSGPTSASSPLKDSAQEVLLMCLAKSFQGQPDPAAAADRLLRERYASDAMIVTGEYCSSAEPSSQAMPIPALTVLRTSSLEELRARLAAITKIPSSRQLLYLRLGGASSSFVVVAPDNDSCTMASLVAGQRSIYIRCVSDTRLARWARIDDWTSALQRLADLANAEWWGAGFCCLKYYLCETFSMAMQTSLINYCRQPSVACFNSGLTTPGGLQIYGLFKGTAAAGAPGALPADASICDLRQWQFKCWATENDAVKDVNPLPEAPSAAICRNPEELFFQRNLKLLVNNDLILADLQNKKLLDGVMKQIGASSQLQGKLFGLAVEEMKRKLRNDFLLAVPQYGLHRIQFLLPLCFDDTNEQVHLVLVVDKMYKTRELPTYLGHTLLTPMAAYLNARLLARPTRQWVFDIADQRETKNALQMFRACMSWAKQVQKSSPSARAQGPQTQQLMNSLVHDSVRKLVRQVYDMCDMPESALDSEYESIKAETSQPQASQEAAVCRFALRTCPGCGNEMEQLRDPDTDCFVGWMCSTCGLAHGE